jgi:hypothetical protein
MHLFGIEELQSYWRVAERHSAMPGMLMSLRQPLIIRVFKDHGWFHLMAYATQNAHQPLNA